MSFDEKKMMKRGYSLCLSKDDKEGVACSSYAKYAL